jgi:hypothetical protein
MEEVHVEKGNIKWTANLELLANAGSLKQRLERFKRRGVRGLAQLLPQYLP